MVDKDNIIELWQNVIIQATRDALYEKNEDYKGRALRWFYDHCNHDFKTVCSLANINEEALRAWLWKKLLEEKDRVKEQNKILLKRSPKVTEDIKIKRKRKCS